MQKEAEFHKLFVEDTHIAKQVSSEVKCSLLEAICLPKDTKNNKSNRLDNSEEYSEYRCSHFRLDIIFYPLVDFSTALSVYRERVSRKRVCNVIRYLSLNLRFRTSSIVATDLEVIQLSCFFYANMCMFSIFTGNAYKFDNSTTVKNILLEEKNASLP